MTRYVFIFIGTFILGAVIALATRAAYFSPAERAAETQSLAPAPAPVHEKADPHAGHGASSGGGKAPDVHGAAGPVANDGPVNTICAICGMKVDPSLPTIEYQGKKIGFGCRMCPPKFRAEPDKYGPYYLRNERFKP